MASEQNKSTDAIKHQVHFRRRLQARKAEGFLLLTWWGFAACLAWGAGLGYELFDIMGAFPAENIDVAKVEMVGAAVVGGTTMLVLKPFTTVLRWMMVSHPDPPDDDEVSETTASRTKTAVEVLAVAAVIIGIPGTSYITGVVIENELVEMAGVISGFFFWVLAAGCLIQARRTLKRYTR